MAWPSDLKRLLFAFVALASGLCAQLTVVTTQPDLADLIVEFTKPARWEHRDKEGGQIRLVGETLIVNQSERTHRQIVAFLNMLALAQEETAVLPDESSVVQ